jgi:hypothetical protein
MRGGTMASSGFVWIKMPAESLFWYGRVSAVRYGENNPSTD